MTVYLKDMLEKEVLDNSHAWCKNCTDFPCDLKPKKWNWCVEFEEK